MFKILVLTVATLSLWASSAGAAGLNLAWGNCPAEGGLQNKTFACASNTGSHILYVSYIPGPGIVNASGVEATIDIFAQGAGFPDWWAFKNAGNCRQTSLSTSADFTAETGTNCVDYWAGQASGGIASYSIGYNATANRARLFAVYAVAPALTGPLTAGTEYYALKCTLNSAKTVGAGACAGCTNQVCLTLTSLNITQPVGVGDQLITNEAVTRTAAWQSASTSLCNFEVVQPVQNRIWGTVRSLYR